jgi:hypothetical protein
MDSGRTSFALSTVDGHLVILDDLVSMVASCWVQEGLRGRAAGIIMV